EVIVHDERPEAVQCACWDHVTRGRADREARGTPEGTSLAWCTLHAYIPMHHGHQALRDREPEPGAPILARGRSVHLRKGLKELLLGLSRDADAGIANGKIQHSFGGVGLDACDRHRYFALVGEFHGIADEIHQHLPETAGVS